jgi:hypothetical protein
LDLDSYDDSGVPFDKSVVRWLGINVSAGGAWEGAIWTDTYVYIDSVTFSDAATANVGFDSGVDGLAVNIYNSPVEGSTATHEP